MPERLTSAAQQHQRTLYATGGKLALNKCTWVLVNWIWKDGKATMAKYEKSENGTCTDNSPEKLIIDQSETGKYVIIPHLNPTHGYRTLGIWIAANGNQHKQLAKLQTGVDLWLDRIGKSSLSDQDKNPAYTSFLRPQFLYPLGCTTIVYKKLKKLFCPVLDQIMHTMGLNEHFPLMMVHAGPAWLGLGIDDLPTLQGVAQLQLLLGHVNKQDRTGTLILIEQDYLELVIGLGKFPLMEPQIALLDHTPTTWITSICSFLQHQQRKVELRHRRVVPLQSDRDIYIMKLAIEENYKLELIQQCHLFLKVATLADLIKAAGDKLEEWAYKGPDRNSSLQWPK